MTYGSFEGHQPCGMLPFTLYGPSSCMPLGDFPFMSIPGVERRIEVETMCGSRFDVFRQLKWYGRRGGDAKKRQLCRNAE